ncbi:Glycine receptor subunit alpha-3 [Halocaridina rubra]|uniref:Glycine receptor subunit alpha-3 n=1 Tax=Halocaridina rubra TaxID=373956 RepID=A0AAN8ZW41_HALRR
MDANTDDVIKYHWVENVPIDLPDELEIAQFDLLSQSTEEMTQHFVTGNFSGLLVHFSLRRQNGYHVLQTYVPTILIVAISWVSFWLDPNAVPGRVSLGVTTLLTLTTLASGIRQSLPPVSYVKAIDVWVGMCMIMVFGALLEFTVVNWMANKKIVNPNRTFRIPRLLAGSDAEQVGRILARMEVEEEEEEKEEEVVGEKSEKQAMKEEEKEEAGPGKYRTNDVELGRQAIRIDPYTLTSLLSLPVLSRYQSSFIWW